MAKSNRQVYKVPQPKPPKGLQFEQAAKPQAPVLPERNGLCYGVFFGLMGLGIVLNGLFAFYLAANAFHAYHTLPVNWLQVGLYAVLTVASVFLLRAVIYGSFVIGAAVAGRTQSYTAQMKICQWAKKIEPILPGGSSWATQAIIQKMLEKEQFKEAIVMGTAEYEATAKKNPKDQTLAGLAACVATAYLMQDEHHKSIEWSEKASKSFEEIFEQIAKSGGLKKYAGQQVLETLQIQYAQVLFNLGTSYMQVQNRFKAKETFKNALQQGRKAPDSAQKRDIIRACEECLSRLKHF